jgi:hypothetical protein
MALLLWLSQDGGWADCSKNIRASLVNKYLPVDQINLISAGSVSLDSTFKLHFIDFNAEFSLEERRMS